mmetsp:Transcript_100091/g.183848  ORF Transcript_100091/g.183848 Transcript_100091/m.183848 type:complete len:777 (-) Transcript_100091:191-2521(-)
MSRIALLLITLQAGCNAECNANIPESCSTDAADVSDLMQTKVKVSNLEVKDLSKKVMLTRAEQKAKLLADRAYYNSLADMSVTTYLADVPLHNTHSMPGGLHPSELELKTMVSMLADFTDAASMHGFCTRLIAYDNDCTCDAEEDEIDVAVLTCSQSQLDLFLEFEKEYGYPEPTFVEPNQIMSALPTFDVSYDELPSLLETAADGATNIWGIDRIDGKTGTDGTYSAYPGSTNGSGAHVYVADTGVNIFHNDFEGRAQNTAECTGGKGKCELCSAATYPTCGKDGHGHGTHCAGTIGGKTYGVAKKVNIYNMKVLNPSGWTGDILASLNWVIAHGSKPAIWSASLGGPGTNPSYEQAFAKAKKAGVVVSVAAGNSNNDACKYSPAFAPSAITVGSTDSNDKRSSFSNYGICIDIWAPGRSIKSADSKSNGSRTMSGTSMACPHVSGAMGLFMSDLTNKDADHAESFMKSIAIPGEVWDRHQSVDAMLYTGGDKNPIVLGATYTTTTFTTSTTTTTVTTTTTTTVVAGSLFICANYNEKCGCPGGSVKYKGTTGPFSVSKPVTDSIQCHHSNFGSSSPSGSCYCALNGAIDGTYSGQGVTSLSGLARCKVFPGACTAKTSFPKPTSWTDISISITELTGDFQSANEYADASINGKFIAKCSSGTDCSGGNKTCIVGSDIGSYITTTDKAIEVVLQASAAVGYCNPWHVSANVTIYTTPTTAPTPAPTLAPTPAPTPLGTDCNGTKAKAAKAAEKLGEVVKAVNETIDSLKEFEKLT